MISAALRAVAAYVDDNATGPAWDPHQRLTDEQRVAKSQKIGGLATEIRVLADASEARNVRYPEYVALKDRLYAFGITPPLQLEEDVAAAFRQAQGPTPPRTKGWLRPS